MKQQDPKPLRASSAGPTEFDRCPDRRHTDSVKWNHYGDDVLPLWVADMDVKAPDAVLRALQERTAHGVFGYGSEPRELAEVLCERLSKRFRWSVGPDQIVFIPGVMPGANVTCRITSKPGDTILLQTPLYPPLRRMPRELERKRVELALVAERDGAATVDWDALEAAVAAAGAGVFVLCNPQNPTGRAFSRTELERLAAACLRRDLYICSDEIHADLVHDGHEHIPIASLDDAIAERCITLMAPSKTYNLAGLGCAFAVIRNAALRAKFRAACGSYVPHVNVLAYTAAVAAYTHGDDWLERIRRQLLTNRDLLVEYVRDQLEGVTMSSPEGTYLGWLDCSGARLPTSPYLFFLNEAKVALNDGMLFSATTSKHVRINFGCSSEMLMTALERMRGALRIHHSAR